MRRCGHVAALTVAAIAFGVGGVDAQTKDDPLVGRWTLDRAKSEFSGNIPEKRYTIFEWTENGLKHITETVIANGSTDRVEYVAKFDSKDVPISNSFLWTVSVKRVDARTTERSGKVMGEIVETSTRTVSPDGQTLTIVTSGVNNGTDYSSTQVFTRDKR